MTAHNKKTSSEDFVVEFLTRPPPIRNLTIDTSDTKMVADWKTAPGADSFELKWFQTEKPETVDDIEPLETIAELKEKTFSRPVKPVLGYVLQIRSAGIDFFGNYTTGEWRMVSFYSEFPPVKKLSFDDLGCDSANYSWSHVGYNASYKVNLYDMDLETSVGQWETKDTKYGLHSLLNANKYLVTIHAFNSDTRGDPAEAGFVTELCAAENVHSPHQDSS